MEDLEKLPSKLVVVQKEKCFIFNCVAVVEDLDFGDNPPTIYPLDGTTTKANVRVVSRREYPRVCEHCGDNFVAQSPLAKYCLDKPCRLNAFRARKAKSEANL
jgi:hypothetical protein